MIDPYDTKELLTNLKAIRSQGDTISSFTYSYSKIDNRTSMTLDHVNVLVNYGYDGISRLTSESWNIGAAHSSNNQYTAQPQGNESGFSNTVTATPTAGILSSPCLAAYKYDEAGNRTGKYTLAGGSGYTVDDDNKLTSEYPFTLTTLTPISTTTQDNWVELDFGASVDLSRLDVSLPDTNRRFKVEYHDGTSYHGFAPLAVLGANLDQEYYQPFATDCRFLSDGLIVQKLRYWQESGSSAGVSLTAYTGVDGTQIVYGYDANGNQTSRTQGTSVETYAHDYANRIATYSDQQVAYSYIFSPSGERMAKTNVGTGDSEWYIYDGDDVVADYALPSGGAYSLTATYANGLGIDSKVARFDAQGAPSYYIPDALGSVHRILDGSQNVVNTYLTNAWGESLISIEGQSNRYGFTQRERDGESSLMHYRARSYDPRLGRFVQCDPKGMGDGPNRYVYVKNNPIVGVDPYGLYSGTISRFLFTSINRIRNESNNPNAMSFARVVEKPSFSAIVVRSQQHQNIEIGRLSLRVEVFLPLRKSEGITDEQAAILAFHEMKHVVALLAFGDTIFGALEEVLTTRAQLRVDMARMQEAFDTAMTMWNAMFVRQENELHTRTRAYQNDWSTRFFVNTTKYLITDNYSYPEWIRWVAGEKARLWAQSLNFFEDNAEIATPPRRLQETYAFNGGRFLFTGATGGPNWVYQLFKSAHEFVQLNLDEYRYLLR